MNFKISFNSSNNILSDDCPKSENGNLFINIFNVDYASNALSYKYREDNKVRMGHILLKIMTCLLY